MGKEKDEDTQRSGIATAVQDLIELAKDGEIDFKEVLRPTRFKEYRIDY
jgi:Tfp pilus assembly ATPase PilU